MIQRRHFLAAGAALAAGAWGTAFMGPAWAQNAPDLGTPEVPENGVRRIPLGGVEVLAINDGAARRPLTEGFVRGVPLAEVQKQLQREGLPTEYIDIPFTVFMVVAPGRRILIDTGNGEFGAVTTGRALANLARAGITLDSIDTVLISHFHGDHINGLRRRDGSWVFPKAQVVVPAAEWAHWMDDDKMAAAPEGARGAFQNVRRVFGPVADKVRKVDGGAVLAPGVTAIAAHGHTPGHTLFRVESQDKRFTYLGDLSNVPALFVRQPDWAVQFDMDAEAARLTRRRVLDEAVADGGLVGGFHFPFPAVGTVLKDGAGYDFDPFRAL